jgi:hypothetical protein
MTKDTSGGDWLDQVRGAVSKAGRHREPVRFEKHALAFLYPSDHPSCVLPKDGSHAQKRDGDHVPIGKRPLG